MTLLVEITQARVPPLLTSVAFVFHVASCLYPLSVVNESLSWVIIVRKRCVGLADDVQSGGRSFTSAPAPSPLVVIAWGLHWRWRDMGSMFLWHRCRCLHH